MLPGLGFWQLEIETSIALNAHTLTLHIDSSDHRDFESVEGRTFPFSAMTAASEAIIPRASRIPRGIIPTEKIETELSWCEAQEVEKRTYAFPWS